MPSFEVKTPATKLSGDRRARDTGPRRRLSFRQNPARSSSSPPKMSGATRAKRWRRGLRAGRTRRFSCRAANRKSGWLRLKPWPKRWSARGADRSSLVIAFGGGIVNDMAGFLAAIFMRGIPVLQIPTTLLAQVDAAVGGKTGVNLVAGKNLIGSFHQPLAVLIDPAVLATLPPREYRAGLFEVIKCGIIAQSEPFQVAFGAPGRCAPPASRTWWTRSSPNRCGSRRRWFRRTSGKAACGKILNFGHTVGHALEAETAYTRFLHGEAVAWGMQAAVHLAEADTLPEWRRRRRHARHDPALRSDSALPMASLLRACLAGWSRTRRPCRARCISCCRGKIGEVTVVSGLDDSVVLSAIQAALG